MPQHPAEILLAALGKERATFQTFPDHPNAAGHPLILHGPHKVRASRLAELNRAGHGVFVMVNHGDLQGRRAENVTAVAAYFVDLDGSPSPAHGRSPQPSWSSPAPTGTTRTGASRTRPSRCSRTSRSTWHSCSTATPPFTTCRASCVSPG